MRRIGRYVRQQHIGLVALMVALGGTAYAADKIDTKDIAPKAVTSKQIAPKAVQTKHIAPKAVKSKQIAPKAVSSKQVKDDSITGADIDESTLQVTRVVARFRESADHAIPRTTPPSELGHLVAHVGPWTQQANESDEISGLVTARIPAGCTPSVGGTRGAALILARPGATAPIGGPPTGIVAIVQLTALGSRGSTVVTGTVMQSGILSPDPDSAEPGAVVTRNLDVYAIAFCGDDSTASPVIDQIDLNVVGNR